MINLVYSSNAWLSTAQQQVNAKYIWQALKAKGWTENAIAGLLGNTHVESSHNPGIWEGLNANNMSRGFGLVQWTPASGIHNWANNLGLSPTAMDTQLKAIDEDALYGWIPTSNYNLTFSEFKKSTQSPEWLAQAYLLNFERPAVQYQPARSTHARYWYNQLKGVGGSTVTGDINAMIKWFEDRLGKVKYSMSYLRVGPHYYDCSSAVFSALIAGGFRPKGSVLGSTETLYSLEGTLLIPIDFSEVQRGDIFVAGPKGGSSYGAGHTGVYYGDGKIIHCNYADNGISITGIAGRTGSPVHWYRLRGARVESSDGTVIEQETFDIRAVNNGMDTIESNELIKLIGRRQRELRIEAENPEDLKRKAMTELNSQLSNIYQFNVSLADLSLLDENVEEIKLFNTYLITNELLPINLRLQVAEKSYSISNPNIKNVTLGEVAKTATGTQVDLMRRK